jgi:hypothetical protein
MSEIVFARTRHVYDSYLDFWRLAELSEYPIIYLDEMELLNKDMTYISAPFNGEFHELEGKKRECKLILWNLERPAGSGGLNKYIRHLHAHIRKGRIDNVIVSDITLANETKFIYVPVGSHEGLGSPGTEKHYDFIHLMCYSNRRGPLFQTPEMPRERFADCSIAMNGWGEERHTRLQQSKYMLNVHQDDDLYMEPLRFALAAAYGLPVITENLYAKSPPYVEGITTFPLPWAEEVMMRAVQKYDEFVEGGLKLREAMIGPYSFRRCIGRNLK